MAIPSFEAVERIMDDSDHNSSAGCLSDEQEEFQMCSFSALDMPDVAQVFFMPFYYISFSIFLSLWAFPF